MKKILFHVLGKIDSRESLLAFFCLLLLGYGSIPFEEPLYSGYDLHTYQRMAEAFPGVVDTAVNAPLRYRIVGPWLAALIPGPTIVGFRLLALLGLVLFFFFLHQLFKEYLGNAVEGRFALILLALNPYLIGFVSWDYFQVSDILGVAFLTGGIWAAARNRALLFLVFTVLGAGTREISLAALPVAWVLLHRKGDYAALKKFILLSLPGVLVYLGIRHFLNVEGYHAVSGVEFNAAKFFSWETYFRGFVNAWIPVLPLVLLGWKPIAEFLKQNRECVVWVLLIYATSFLAGDQERLLLPLAPVVYLLIAKVLIQFQSKLFWTILFLAGLATYFHHQIGIINWPNAQTTLAIRLTALIVVAVMGIVLSPKRIKA